jgi:hypothetical protein
MVKKLAALAATSLGAVALMATPAFAHECVNASKPQRAGAQVILDANDNPIEFKKGVEKRLEKGLIDPETGEGLHGIIGFDVGDGTIVSTYIVGPTGEIPPQAQENGPACRGITNIEVYFSECLG